MLKKLMLLSVTAVLGLVSVPSVSNADMVVIFGLPNNNPNNPGQDDLLTEDDDPFDFETTTGTFTDDSGLVAFFEAFVDGNTGVLNAAGDAFGVNAVNGVVEGSANDATSQLDGDQGLESIQITFSGPVSAVLTEIGVSSFGSTVDSGTVSIGGVVTDISSGTTTSIPEHTDLVGQTLTIAFTGGNGISIDTLTFDVTAVPEPSSFAMFGLLSLGALARRRR